MIRFFWPGRCLRLRFPKSESTMARTDRRQWTNSHAAKSVQPDFNRFWCCRSRRSPPWAPLKHRPADRRRQCPSAPLPAAAAAAPARRRSFLARCAAKSVHRVGVRVLRLLWADRALFGCCGCPGPAAVAPTGSAQPRLGGVDRRPSSGTSRRRLGGQQAGCYGCKLRVRFSFGRLLLSVRAATCAVCAQDEFCTSRILGLVQVDELARCGSVCAAVPRGGAHAAPSQTSWFSSCNWVVLFCLTQCCVGPDFSCAELAGRPD